MMYRKLLSKYMLIKPRPPTSEIYDWRRPSSCSDWLSFWHDALSLCEVHVSILRRVPGYEVGELILLNAFFDYETLVPGHCADPLTAASEPILFLTSSNIWQPFLTLKQNKIITDKRNTYRICHTKTKIVCKKSRTCNTSAC